jgi:hypothetical protein
MPTQAWGEAPFTQSRLQIGLGFLWDWRGIVRIDRPPRFVVEIPRYSTMSPLIGSFFGDPRLSVLAVLSLSFAMYAACFALSEHRLRHRRIPIRCRRRRGDHRTR